MEKTNASRIVFDSLSELRLLAQNSLRYRRQILALKQFFIGRKCTVLLLDDRTSEGSDLQLQSIAHGVVSLDQLSPVYGARTSQTPRDETSWQQFSRWLPRFYNSRRRASLSSHVSLHRNIVSHLIENELKAASPLSMHCWAAGQTAARARFSWDLPAQENQPSPFNMLWQRLSAAITLLFSLSMRASPH